MEVHDFELFKEEIELLYGNLDNFVTNEITVRDIPTLTSNFRFKGFDFELFAQPIAVEKQNAYRHMIIEHHLMLKYPELKSEIIRVKEDGMKTEPAFAQVLGLVGNPYDELLVLGDALGIV